MRRVLAIFTALALLLALAAPASAKKGGRDKPPAPPPPPCELVDGVLSGFSGGGYLCAWTVDDLDTEWIITIDPDSVASKVMVSVRDNSPVGDFCVYKFVPGRSTELVTTDPFILPSVVDGEQCGLPDAQQFDHGDPHEFFLLVETTVRGGNTATVTVSQVHDTPGV